MSAFRKLNAIFLTRPSEVGFVALYLLLWLFPVATSSTVSLTGRTFSFVGTNWQLISADIVLYAVFTAFVSGMASALVCAEIFKERLDGLISFAGRLDFNRTQQLATAFVALISAQGLFKSFAGLISDNNYSGPVATWLDYGAWGVTYSMAILLFVGELIRSKLAFVAILAVVFLSSIPFLASGSRIDYMSMMLAMLAYSYLFIGRNFAARAVLLSVIGVLMLLVALSVGYLRYHGLSFPDTLSKLTAFTEHTNASMLYMSTIGDIGASFFQVVGLIHSETIHPIDTEYALKVYLERLLPGPMFPNRPGDFATSLPENIGGGALHSLGEGYLIGAGAVSMGILFGCLASFSLITGRQLKHQFTPVLFLLFSFPWLILIRGGWYQLFSIAKATQVLLVMVLMLTLVQWLSSRIRCNTP